MRLQPHRKGEQVGLLPYQLKCQNCGHVQTTSSVQMVKFLEDIIHERDDLKDQIKQLKKGTGMADEESELRKCWNAEIEKNKALTEEIVKLKAGLKEISDSTESADINLLVEKALGIKQDA